MLIDALQKSRDLVEDVARRKHQFQQVWDKMKPPSAFKRRLILFGGIATVLCNDDAALRYAGWLTDNSDAHLYVCYESGPGALARAQKLDQHSLEPNSGLPTDPASRMMEKEKLVRSLEGRLRQALADNHNEEVLSRVHFIPLRESLTTYIMIADDDVYITPLLETRSSETLSFALASKPVQFRLDVFNFVIYHLGILEHSEAAAELIRELETDISTGDANDN